MQKRLSDIRKDEAAAAAAKQQQKASTALIDRGQQAKQGAIPIAPRFRFYGVFERSLPRI
jgi:hypothetical protein